MTPSEWDAWPAREPSRGFAERVVAGATRVAPTRKRSLIGRSVVGSSLALVAAAASLLFYLETPSRGDATALERRELRLGSHGRATAVLEQGAHVSWLDDAVTQSAGEVFYRVDRGNGFMVHTPAGDLGVKGTCFRVTLLGSDGSGAARAMVLVLEGSVVASRAGASINLTAGDGASLDEGGVHRGASGETRGTTASSQSAADSVRAAMERLAAIEAEKAKLEASLAEAQRQLARPPAQSMPSDLSDPLPNDWGQLAKAGIIKYRLPCGRPKDWTPSASVLTTLGLSPDDAPLLKRAHEQSNERLWAVVKPLCVEVVGTADAADKLGTYTCSHLVLVQATERDRPAFEEKMRSVAEMRAGLQPTPALTDATDPLLRLFLAMTGEMGQFEHDLAESLGAEEAHRVATSDGMCVSRDSWGPRM